PRRELLERRHPPPAATDLDRPAAILLPGLRHGDPPAGQHPRLLLSRPSRALPRVRRADLLALPGDRSGDRPPVPGLFPPLRPDPRSAGRRSLLRRDDRPRWHRRGASAAVGSHHALRHRRRSRRPARDPMGRPSGRPDRRRARRRPAARRLGNLVPPAARGRHGLRRRQDAGDDRRLPRLAVDAGRPLRRDSRRRGGRPRPARVEAARHPREAALRRLPGARRAGRPVLRRADFDRVFEAALAGPGPLAMRRSPRLGIRREILILLPAALLLLVVISSFTLFSYRNAVLRLEEERRSEAARIASGLAAELSALLAPTEADLARIAGGLRAAPAGISILDASGGVVAAIGPLDLRPIPRPRKPGSGLPATLGPLAAENPSVVAFAPLPGRDRVVRVVLPAATLAGQLRATRLLSFVVLPINAALVLLVLFALQQVLGPWERLLARAELAGAPRSPDEDEIEFLLATFERAMAALSAAKLPAEDDLDALERTLAPSFQSGLLLLDRRGGVLSLNDLGADLLGIPVPAADTPLHEALAERPEM